MYEHRISSMSDLAVALTTTGAHEAIIKRLSKNHNDKNQVYCGSDFQPLHPFFSVSFDERVASISSKKKGKVRGAKILEARFENWSWLDTAGRLHATSNVKMIIYPQYPEARISGFRANDNTMPESMSIEYTKTHPGRKRFLVLGKVGYGDVIAMMIVEPSNTFCDDFSKLPKAFKSRVWHKLDLKPDNSVRLKAILGEASNKLLLGCRLDTKGVTLPFNGTQVCGYTLEHACGIRPNADKNGDFEGIELKAHTALKVTLFTPEPDRGLYNEDFNQFMKTYGYEKECGSGEWRFTGLHRAGVQNAKSKLTLSIQNYDPNLSVSAQAGNDIIVALMDKDGKLAAGWSLERMLNSWGAKHNEVVYVPATKTNMHDQEYKDQGYSYNVEFDNQVLWCHRTSIDRMLQAILSGTIFLDPASKYVDHKPSLNKRRSQWRVNNIRKASKELYEEATIIDVNS